VRSYLVKTISGENTDCIVKDKDFEGKIAYAMDVNGISGRVQLPERFGVVLSYASDFDTNE
jgi:hypothetical protein